MDVRGILGDLERDCMSAIPKERKRRDLLASGGVTASNPDTFEGFELTPSSLICLFVYYRFPRLPFCTGFALVRSLDCHG